MPDETLAERRDSREEAPSDGEVGGVVDTDEYLEAFNTIDFDYEMPDGDELFDLAKTQAYMSEMIRYAFDTGLNLLELHNAAKCVAACTRAIIVERIGENAGL